MMDKESNIAELKKELAELRTVDLMPTEIAMIVKTRQGKAMALSGIDLEFDLLLTQETQKLQQALLAKPKTETKKQTRKTTKAAPKTTKDADTPTQVKTKPKVPIVTKAAVKVDGLPGKVTVET